MSAPLLDISDDPPSIGFVPARLSFSVTTPSWTMRLPERSSGSASPRFSRHSRRRAASSSPMMIRASEPPINERRFNSVASTLPRRSDMATSQKSWPGRCYDISTCDNGTIRCL